MSQLVNDKRIKTKVVLLSNKIEQIIETWNHLNEYPSNYAEWRKKKANKKMLHSVLLHLNDIFEIKFYVRFEIEERGRGGVGLVIKE